MLDTKLQDKLQSLAHLSWKLKIIIRPSFVWSSVRPTVCKLLTIYASSPEQLDQFQPNMAQSIVGRREYKNVQIKGHAFQRGDNSENTLTKTKKYSSLEPLAK